MTNAQRHCVCWSCLLVVACGKSTMIESPPDAALDATRDAAEAMPDAAHDAAVDVTRDAGPRPDLPTCTLPERRDLCEPASSLSVFSVLVEASRFGEGATLRAADRDQLLVDRGPEPDVLAQVDVVYEGEALVDALELPTGFDARDVLEDAWNTAHVIGCDDVGCRLLHRRHNSDQVEPWMGSELPLSFAPRGLVEGPFGDGLTAQWPCVFGQGVRCFDGTQWQTELADVSVRAATMGVPQVVATEDGRILVRAGTNTAWTEAEGIAAAAVRWVDNSVHGGQGIASMLSGAWTWTTIDAQGEVTQCALDTPYAAMRAIPNADLRFGLTHASDVIYDQGPDGEWQASCSSRAVSFDDVLDITMSACGIARNQRFLTRTALWGGIFCAND